MKFIGLKYTDFDGKRKWELLYENIILVIIDNNIESSLDINLLGIDATSLNVKWELGGVIENENQYDGIVNIYIKDNFVHASTFSGFDLKINYQTGKILEKIFRK